MQKLLIVEQSAALSDGISAVLQDQWEIHTCTDGYAAIDTIQYLQPDAMILNLMLPQKDGLSVLADCFPRIPSVTMALTTYSSTYVEQAAASLGVKYIMQLPCTADAIKDRLMDIVEACDALPNIVARHLGILNFNRALDGYQLLLVAIPEYAGDRKQRLHKELYSKIAQICGAGDEQCVEHSIRSAIHDAWKHRDVQSWSHYFPLNDGDVECPTNKEFLSRLADLI